MFYIQILNLQCFTSRFLMFHRVFELPCGVFKKKKRKEKGRKRWTADKETRARLEGSLLGVKRLQEFWTSLTMCPISPRIPLAGLNSCLFSTAVTAGVRAFGACWAALNEFVYFFFFFFLLQNECLARWSSKKGLVGWQLWVYIFFKFFKVCSLRLIKKGWGW